MSVPVRWSPEALHDRGEIWDYLAARNPAAAVRLDALFSAAAARLSEYPDAGRAGLIAGTRELFPHENYRLVYERAPEAVWILALVHGARQWPPVTAGDA